MQLPTLLEFVRTVNTGTQQEIVDVSKRFCPCNYVHHWVYSMNRGRWNPMLTEMDAELRDVTDVAELYLFMLSKHNEHTQSKP